MRLLPLLAASVAACVALAGFSFLPASSPTVRDVTRSVDHAPESDIVFFDIDARVAEFLSSNRDVLLSDNFSSRGVAPLPKIGAGDVLQISIWEPGGSGLFGPVASQPAVSGGSLSAGARQATLQPIIVDRDGFISVPFAGRVPVAGVSPDVARARIEDRLKDKAIQPQVMVTVAANNSHTASVGGEVNRAGIVPLSSRGDRLLDVIAAAGGAKYPVYESVVRVTRGSVSAAVSLQVVVNHPSENIYVQPGDSVYVMRAQRTFTAMGAAGKVGHYPFEQPSLNLAEAVAKGGGLVDGQSDLSGVFLFRYETGRRLAELVPKYGQEPNRLFPVVYRTDWRTAHGLVTARRVMMRDRDMVLIANAEGTQLLKMLTLMRGASAIYSDITKAATSTSN